MAYITAIDQKCQHHGCNSRAGYLLYNMRNEQIAKLCRTHAHSRLKELQRTENKTPRKPFVDPWIY